MADLGHAARTGELRANGRRPASGNDSGSGGRSGHGHGKSTVPGGRAVLGGLLVAAAVVGLFWASTRQSGPAEYYVVARHAVAPGTRLTAADLTRQPIDLPPALAQRAFHDVAEVDGATTIAPVGEGELVQASAVVAKPSAQTSRELSFAVPAAGLGPGLEAGERVDVVATFGTGGDAFSAVVLRQALVVALDRDGDDQRDVTVTVAVDDAIDAVALAHASQEAKLTLVRATGAAPIPPNAPVFRAPAAAGSGSGRL